MSNVEKPAWNLAHPLAGVVLLVFLWIVWGSSWPAMRAVFVEIPVWQFRAVSTSIGGIALLLMGMLLEGGTWRVPRALWGWLIAAGLFNITAWHVLTGYGLQMLGSGHAAIVCYTMPVWAAMLSAAVLKEPMTARKIVALGFGLAAVAVLLSANFSALGTSPLGIALVLISAITWAIGTVIVKRFDWQANMYALAGWQLIVGFFPMIVAALATEDFALHTGSARADWGMIYVVFFAVILGYALWFQIVKIFPPTVAGIGSLMVPVIGVISGAIVFDDEVIGWRELVALGCVMVAVGLVVFHGRRTPPAAEQAG